MMNNRRGFLWALGIAMIAGQADCADPKPDSDPRAFELRVTRARKIYSDGNHNAFTGMARLGDRTFVTFRSGATHMTMDGKIRIIASQDLERWQPVNLAGKADIDFRDPKLVTFGGKLLCYFAAWRERRPKTPERGAVSMVVCSADGRTFEEPRAVEGVRPGAWLWHVAARGDMLYGAAYGGGVKAATLYRSKDGIQWEKATDFPTPSSEVYLDFAPDGVLWALARDGLTLCRAETPYRELTVQNRFSMPQGGPLVKRLPTGCVIITRQWDPPGRRNLRSEISWLPDGGELRSVTRLPSGGDTSYAAWLDLGPGRAIVSYYSSHEHKMDVPIGCAPKDAAEAEHTTGADIFLADVSYKPYWPAPRP
jgi:hypothetical protein